LQPRRASILFGSLTLFCLIALFLSLTVGSVDLSASQVWRSLFASDGSMEAQVLQELRVPRTVAAFITGGLLAMAGVIMQVLLRNPLADPYILGVSGGAAVAALGTMLLGLSGYWVSPAAFLGAIFSIVLVFVIAGSGRAWSVSRLLLTGVVVSAGWGAVINIMLTTTANNSVQSMLFWLMGDLSQSRLTMWHSLPLILGLGIGMWMARSLNVLSRGEMVAAALGVEVRTTRNLLYIIASLLTASAVTIAGSIGFVGLIVPHMLRLLGARDHRLLIPASLLLGGGVLVLADTVARTIIAPQQLPAGVITAIIGVPAFLVILRNSSRTS